MYIDKLYTKLFSNKDWDGIETLRAEVRSISQRLFAEMTHYTTSNGAKGIMKEGFKPGTFGNSDGHISAFLQDDDTIRNDERYNLNTMIDNVNKREKRYGYNATRNGKKLVHRSPYVHKDDVHKWNNEKSDQGYWSINPLSRFGTIQDGGFDYPYNHGGGAYRHYPNNNQYTEEDKDGFRDKKDTEVDGITRTNNGGKDATWGHFVTFPAGYKQLSQINGIGRGNMNKKSPVYRVKFDTDTDEGIKSSWGVGNEVPINIINKDSQKLEIPRGMYKGTKKLKRGYINDYNDFNPNDFNTEDIPTREAVEDIKKKSRFLNSGHGKK